MKLSEIKGERTLEVIAELIDPIANIAANPAAKALFERKTLPEGMEKREFAVQRLRKGVPSLLKDNKADVIAILAAIEGVTQEEYAASLNLAKLISDAADLISDEAFAAFFTSAQTEKSFGSALENSGAIQ